VAPARPSAPAASPTALTSERRSSAPRGPPTYPLHPFLWERGMMRDLGTLGVTMRRARPGTSTVLGKWSVRRRRPLDSHTPICGREARCMTSARSAVTAATPTG
jgi:hypothetical protein